LKSEDLMMTNLQKVKKIIKETKYMTIAVSDYSYNNWIANLYFAVDKDYNFYWYSSKDSQHSKYISENGKISISIFNSEAMINDVDAVYIEAKAHEIKSKKELLAGCLCYAKKMWETKFLLKRGGIQKFVNAYHDFQGDSVLRMYKAVPQKFWKLAPSKIINGKFMDSRIKVNIR